MAESDGSSSEMSDDALQNLVSRLVEVGGEDVDTTAEPQSPGHARALIMGATSAQAAAPSDYTDSSGDEELVSAATGQPIWPSLAQDQPSPIQAPRGTFSPRADGYDREADLLESVHASDDSSEGGGGGGARAGADFPLAAIATRAVEEARVETDSCGYEGDVGEGAKRMTTPSFRRAAGIAPPGFSVNKDGAEADDEASGKEATKSLVPQQPASLDMSAREMTSHYRVGRVNPPQTNEGSPWDALNESLREQGFREVSLSRPGGSIAVPDPTSLADTLRDVVFKHGERGRVIQEMSLELQRRDNVGGHRESVLNESFRRERSDLSKRSAGAEARAAALEAENKRLQDQLALDSRRARAESASLASQLKQSEHRVKAKEAAAQRLMDKLQEEAEKERLSQQRERAILTKFRQKEAAAVAAVRGSGGGGANDSRVAESLIAHSKAQERSEAEMDKLRAEISRLGDELREKENTILKHRLGPDWTPDLDPKVAPASSDELRELRDRLAESERSVRVMKQRETRALERCASMQEECAEVQAKADETQDALVNARLELSSRPSLRNWRASQRRIQDLETKLGQATSQAKEAMDVAELRRWVDTRELMRRDRGNHRLKLDRLEELPTAVLKQVVQDACRLLSLQDVSLLGSSVSKLIKAVQMLPRLERFVNSVCGFVFRHSTEVLSAPSDGMLSQALAGKARTMEDVLPLLELWLARAQEPVKLKEFHRGVLRVLDTRAGESQGARDSVFKSDRAATSAIQHLVDFERRSLQEMHLNERADRSMKDDPSPVNRVVQHFQLLFGVSSLGGCLPKLNELYRFSSETKTFLRTCGDLLNMPEASGSEAIMRRLETVLEGTVDADAEAKLRVSHDADSWAGHSIELAAEA
ncbi:unnamed protein product [Ectocarpus sp. 4 AP-2014]